MDAKKLYDIPAEKFRFATKNDIYHDSKLSTKPVSYFQGAFRRFCKNKGAVVGGIVIAILVLFAIIVPFFTPYQPKYYDMVYDHVAPKSKFFYNLGVDFWDGCKQKNANYLDFMRDYALAQETGREVIKRNEYTVSDDGKMYSYRYDTYYGEGFGNYKLITVEEFNDIQRYQNETGIQVLYPVVAISERKTMLEHNKTNANIYYKVEDPTKAVLRPLLDENGELIPNYWKYDVNEPGGLVAEYNSLRIEGEGFTETVTELRLNEYGTPVFDKDGKPIYDTIEKQYLYAYGRRMSGGTVEVRAEYYEYYIYYHTQVKKDGITEPLFPFGTTSTGKDILACLAYGARFSFIFATIVAIANFAVGVIWGSIAGYYGGKIDLFMERFSEILGSVPSMIVITLLKYHMGSTSQALILFISFFLTGWIGMAGTTRMQFYRFKNQEYVLAARTLGARDARIMFKHIFPNGLGTIVTSFALVIPSMIYSETSLSYLGIINLEAGNTTSVGTLIAAGQNSIVQGAAFVALFPCMFLVLLMLSFNLFGNGLRDAFNPSLRGSED